MRLRKIIMGILVLGSAYSLMAAQYKDFVGWAQFVLRDEVVRASPKLYRYDYKVGRRIIDEIALVYEYMVQTVAIEAFNRQAEATAFSVALFGSEDPSLFVRALVRARLNQKNAQGISIIDSIGAQIDAIPLA